MTDIQDRMVDIARNLLRQSERDKVDWTHAAGGAFDTEVSGKRVRIRSVDDDGNHPFELSIRDRSGTVIERLSTAALNLRDPASARIFAELWERARIDALHVDEVLDDVLDSLR